MPPAKALCCGTGCSNCMDRDRDRDMDMDMDMNRDMDMGQTNFD
jgi:hypothetical protein